MNIQAPEKTERILTKNLVLRAFSRASIEFSTVHLTNDFTDA